MIPKPFIENREGRGNRFQTPPNYCRKIVEVLKIKKHNIVLEPSYGAGNLLRALQEASDHVTGITIEVNVDFLEWETDQLFDWIVGNPPFSPMVVGYKHIEKAHSLLMPYGHVAFILPWYFMTNSDRRTLTWAPYLEKVYHIPRWAFKGVRAGLGLFVLHKQPFFKRTTVDFTTMVGLK